MDASQVGVGRENDLPVACRCGDGAGAQDQGSQELACKGANHLGGRGVSRLSDVGAGGLEDWSIGTITVAEVARDAGRRGEARHA